MLIPHIGFVLLLLVILLKIVQEIFHKILWCEIPHLMEISLRRKLFYHFHIITKLPDVMVPKTTIAVKCMWYGYSEYGLQ